MCVDYTYRSISLVPRPSPQFQFLITCSMQIWGEKAWWILSCDRRHSWVRGSRQSNLFTFISVATEKLEKRDKPLRGHRSIPCLCPCRMWLPCEVLARIWGPHGRCRSTGCWCHQLYTISETLSMLHHTINVCYATYVWETPVPHPDIQETAHCLQKTPRVHLRQYQPLETIKNSSSSVCTQFSNHKVVWGHFRRMKWLSELRISQICLVAAICSAVVFLLTVNSHLL